MVRRMTGVIEIEGLRKEYRRLRGGRTIAVDGLDLEVPEGGVFGFLGPNGAGKTTTIRCLLGLVAPSAGTVRLLGSEVPKGLPGVIGKVGAIVETPGALPPVQRQEEPADPRPHRRHRQGHDRGGPHQGGARRPWG